MKTKNRNKNEKGITLIALVVTIVVLLILAAVTIVMTLGEGGIIQKSKDAKNSAIKATADDEVELAVSNLRMEKVVRDMTAEESRKYLEDDLKKIDKDSTVTINGSKLDIIHRGFSYSIDDDLKIGKDDDNTPFDPVEWDKTAVPESAFVWESDDPNDEGYNTIIGYKSTIDNYPILRYPSRCKIIREDSYEIRKRLDLGDDYNIHSIEYDQILAEIRSYTSNIKVKEYPETVTEISGEEFRFNSVEKIKLPKSLKKIGDYAFSYHSKLVEISIPENVETIGKNAFWLTRNVNYSSSCEDEDLLIICIKREKNSIEGAPWGVNKATVIWNSDGSELNKEYMTAAEKKEWDKTAVPENVFVWKSDDPNDVGYNIIIGYKSSISNYSILRYPSRCKVVEENEYKASLKINETGIRSFTNNIKKKEYPDSVIYILGSNHFDNTNIESIRLSNNLKGIGYGAFGGYDKLTTIKIPKSVVTISDQAFSDHTLAFNNTSDLIINLEAATNSISGAPWGARNATVNWNVLSESELKKEYMTTAEKEEWDKTAVPEDVFVWKSDDPNDVGYNIIIGYNSSISNYPILRYPSRCKVVEENEKEASMKINGNYQDIRSYTSNIRKKEYPDSVIYILGDNHFVNTNIESVRLSNNLKEIGYGTLSGYDILTTIKIPRSVEKIDDQAFSNTHFNFNDTSSIIINIEGTTNSITGAPWGAKNATINWNVINESEQNKEYMTAAEKEEWDKTAVPEDVFIWESNDQNDVGYNTIIGYKATIDNYPILRYPSRCKIVAEDTRKVSEKVKGAYDWSYANSIRSYTSNIKKKEYPDSVIYMLGVDSFYYDNIESIRLSKNLKVINESIYYPKLTSIKIPKSVVKIYNYAFWGNSNLVINLEGPTNSIIGAPWGASNATVNWNYTGE